MRTEALLIAIILTIMPFLAMTTGAQSGEFLVERFSDKAVDLDGDGPFDMLVLYGHVKVDTDSRYTIRAAISPYGNKDVDPYVVEERFDLDIGISEFKLSFPSDYFWNTRHSGTYEIHLQLFDMDEHFMTSADYRTSSYDHRRFEEPGPMVDLLKETAADEPSDLDGNGLYDILAISVEGYSKNEAPVMMYAYMLGELVCNRFELKDGKTTFQFIFNGSVMADAKRNGSYPATIGLGCDRDQKVLFEYDTAEYNYTDFEAGGPLAMFTGELNVKAVDKDTDGKYELLRLTAKVNISYPMTYTMVGGLLHAQLERPIQVMISTKYGTGTFSASLEIPGTEIMASGVDGPYSVTLAIYSMSLEQPLDSLHTRTGAIKATDFEGPEAPIDFTGVHTDRGVDTNGNELFDHLEVTVTVKVKEPGEFNIGGHLGLRGFWFTDVFLTMDLKGAEETMIIRFRGQDIYDHGVDGQFTVMVNIKGEVPKDDTRLPPPIQLTFATNSYRFKQFEHKEPADATTGPVIIDGEEERMAETPVMKATVDKTRPSITFTYADESARPVVFNLVYQRLLVFRDQGTVQDGLYQEGEEVYSAILSSNEWDLSSIKRESLEGGGGKASFTMSTILDLEALPAANDPRDFIEDWARISFTFTVTSKDEEYVSPIAFRLDADSELKIDIAMAFHQKVDGDGLVLEHYLFDDGHTYRYKTHESDGDHIWNGGAKYKANGEVFDQVPDKEQLISFLSPSGREHGFYSWVPKVDVTTASGGTDVQEVEANYYSTDEGLKLYIHYPFSSDIVSLVHDPSVGLDPDNIPMTVIELTTDLDPTLYILALVIAGVVVIIVWRRGEVEDGS